MITTDPKTVTIDSGIQAIGLLPPCYDDTTTIKNETMLFSADRDFAMMHGGPITRAFFDALPEGWDDVVFDSRVHMLMEGWYPCIPGWHLDDVPRTRPDGQPDHLHPAYKAEHILCCVGSASLTQFALGKVVLPEPEPGHVIYGEWHPQIDKLIKQGNLAVRNASTCELLAFDWQSFHQGCPATKDGWRWFGRVSRNTDRVRVNEIRRQTQVYLPNPMGGW